MKKRRLERIPHTYYTIKVYHGDRISNAVYLATMEREESGVLGNKPIIFYISEMTVAYWPRTRVIGERVLNTIEQSDEDMKYKISDCLHDKLSGCDDDEVPPVDRRLCKYFSVQDVESLGVFMRVCEKRPERMKYAIPIVLWSYLSPDLYSVKLE